MKGARIANNVILVQDNGVLELARPKPGETFFTNAEEYSRIDFRAIIGQWQSLKKVGQALLITFEGDATIELANFFDSDISKLLIVQIDDATYVAPELFFQQFAALENPSTVGQGSTDTPASGAYFVDLLSVELAGSLSSDLSSNGLPVDLLPDTPPALPDLPLFPPSLLPDPTRPTPPPPEPPPDLNSAPAITGADTTGAVTEDALPPAQTGVVAFSDSDLADVHSVSATPAGGGYLGTFAASISDPATGDGTGQVTWNFSVDNAALQFLAEGQQLIQTYTVTIEDGQGGTVSQLVTITITGTNDAAVITGDVSGDVIEAGGVANGTPGDSTDTGNLDAADVDNPSDTWQAVAAGAATANGYGTYALNAAGVWTYTLDDNNAAVQALNGTATLTDTFTALTADGTSQIVTVTIAAQNDAPVAVADGNGSDAVVESGVDPGDPSATGNVLTNDTDVDAGDIMTVTEAGGLAPGLPVVGLYGTLTLLADGTWSYTLSNADPDTDALAQGQTATDVFTYTVSDATGATASASLTITITGTNDAPVVTGAVDSGTVTEGSLPVMTATGTVDFGDVDLADAHVTSVTAGGIGYLGTFAAIVNNDSTGDGVGQVTWLFAADNALRQSLGVGQVLVQTYSVEIADGQGGTATQLVTITINGTNDAAVITGDASGAVVEAGGVNNAIPGTPTDTGDLNATDVDDPADTWEVVLAGAVTANGYGTYALDAVGVWTYTLDNENAAVQALVAGGILSDSFTVATIDGTEQIVTVTIDGANDTPDALADFANLIPLVRGAGGPPTELQGAVSLLSNDGDVDAGQTALLRVTQVGVTPVDQTAGIETAIAGLYGTLFIQADGTYRYVLDNASGLDDGEIATETFDYLAANEAGADNEDSAALTIVVQGDGGPDVPIVYGDPAPYYAFSNDAQSPNAILADLTDLMSGQGGQPLDYSLVFFSPTAAADWAWLDQSAIPILSADPEDITNGEAGMYMALVFAGTNGLSAVAFTLLDDNGLEFNITIDAPGNDPGERGSGDRSRGDLIIVNDDIAGTVGAGSGDDVMWILPGTGSHQLDGGGGDDALYGNAGNDVLEGGGGSNFLSGGAGNDTLHTGGGQPHAEQLAGQSDILLGGDGDDSLSSGNGNDLVLGGIDNDVMDGGGGNDVLFGDAGNDTLTGSGGANRFGFAEAGAANVDTITDYQASRDDIVDLSRLLNSIFEPTDDPADFARLVQIGSDVIVQADEDGAANGENWADVAILSGYGTSGADVVNVYFENVNHVLTV